MLGVVNQLKLAVGFLHKPNAWLIVEYRLSKPVTRKLYLTVTVKKHIYGCFKSSWVGLPRQTMQWSKHCLRMCDTKGSTCLLWDIATEKSGLCCYAVQAFKWALLFLFFLLFPTFLICSYFSLLFHENALLSLFFHSKMTFTRKNQEIFSSLASLSRIL